MRLHRPLLIATLALMAGCAENEQASKLADAQACMNDSNPSTVSSCMSKLDGVTGERADLMRCGIKFMEEGFDRSDRLVDVMEQMGSDDGGNPTLGAMTFLAFNSSTDEAVNFENAALAQEFCAKTTAEGFIKLAGFAYIATSLTSAASLVPGFSAGGTLDEQDLKDLIQAINDNPNDPKSEAAKTAIGQTVISTHQSACESESNPDSFCKELDETLDNVVGDPSNPEDVADALLALLDN